MAKWALTTRRLWQRLGVRDPAQEEPEVVYAIQPVYVVGDGSALVPPTHSAVAWSGGLFNPNIGFHGAFEVHARAPGGCFIKDISIGVAGITNLLWRWAIRTATAGLPTIPNKHEMGPLPTLSSVTSGEIIAPGLLGANDPHRESLSQSFMTLDAFIYVPAGSYFYLESAAVNILPIAFSILFSDVPEAPPASPT